VDAALALPRPLLPRRFERPDADLALEREGVPLVQRRKRKAAVRVGGGERLSVEPLRGLGHRAHASSGTSSKRSTSTSPLSVSFSEGITESARKASVR